MFLETEFMYMEVMTVLAVMLFASMTMSVGQHRLLTLQTGAMRVLSIPEKKHLIMRMEVIVCMLRM